MAKNNRYRIVVENKTSPSHRMKKMTIVEAYQSVARRPPASEEGGMVAMSQMATFYLVVEQNFFMGTW